MESFTGFVSILLIPNFMSHRPLALRRGFCKLTCDCPGRAPITHPVCSCSNTSFAANHCARFLFEATPSPTSDRALPGCIHGFGGCSSHVLHCSECRGYGRCHKASGAPKG